MRFTLKDIQRGTAEAPLESQIFAAETIAKSLKKFRENAKIKIDDHQSDTNVEKQKRKTKKERARISPSQILKMMKEVENRFIKPKPQKALDGALGVSLFDIAHSLGTSHAELRRKAERSGDIDLIRAFNHKIMTIVILTAEGKRVESYILDMMAAQHIVAKYDNLEGRFYLDFLIRCKDALTVSLEELNKNTEQISHLKKKLAESEKKQAEAQKRIRKTCEYEVVLGEEYDTYGEQGLKKVAKVAKKSIADMTNTERGLHKIQQNTRKELGLHRSIVNLLVKHNCTDKQILHEADLCLEALENFDSLVNKTGLERALKPKKEYLQPQLISTNEKPRYVS